MFIEFNFFFLFGFGLGIGFSPSSQAVGRPVSLVSTAKKKIAVYNNIIRNRILLSLFLFGFFLTSRWKARPKKMEAKKR